MLSEFNDYYSIWMEKVNGKEQKWGSKLSTLIYLLFASFTMVSYNAIVKSNKGKFQMNQTIYQLTVGQSFFFYAAIVFKGESVRFKWNEDLKIQIFRNFFFYCFGFLSFYSVSNAPIYVNYAVLSSISIFIPALDSIFFRVSFGKQEIIASFVSIISTLIIYAAKLNEDTEKSANYVVFLAMVAEAIFYSCGIVITRKCKNNSTLHTCLHSAVLANISSAIIMIFIENLQSPNIFEFVSNYVFGGILMGFSGLFFIRANIIGDPIDIAIFSLMTNMFWSIFEEFLFFSEFPNFLESLGILLTIANVAIYTKYSK